jgi:hypothetical protein
MRTAFVLPLLLAGCGSATTPQVDLTVVAGTAVPDAALGTMQTLSFAVAGVETAYASYPLAHPFADHREERVVYQPRAHSGDVTFTVQASDGNGAPVASGSTTVTLATGAVAAMVELSPGGTSSGPDLSVGPDFTIGPDFGSVCNTSPDGTTCGLADGCNDAATCVAGACVAHPKANGTVCALAPNNCKNDGICTGGVCGAITNKPAGTVCSPKSNVCHTDGTCNGSGVCGPQGTHPTGYSYDGVYNHRCCGGNPTDISTDVHNCGVCGLGCLNGNSCLNAHGEIYCGCAANSECWSTCCSTAFGNPWVCAAGNCQTNQPIPCPGNGTNGYNPNGPYFCHY